MKNSIYQFILLTSIILIIISCEEKINTPEPKLNEIISHNSYGCVKVPKTNELGNVTNDTIIEARLVNGKLEVNLKFTTHCSAEMKDSIIIEDEKIEIFLEDINSSGSRCTCLHKEEFIFNSNGESKIRIKFNYKAYSKTEYVECADTTIVFN